MLYVNSVDWRSEFTAAETVRPIPRRLCIGGTVEFGTEPIGSLGRIVSDTP